MEIRTENSFFSFFPVAKIARFPFYFQEKKLQTSLKKQRKMESDYFEKVALQYYP